MADSNSKPTFRRGLTDQPAANPDVNDPMWWLACELGEAKLRNRLAVENKWGMGQFDALEEIQARRIEAGQPVDDDWW